ncbi:flagellar biosynthesis protein FlhB [Solimonas sp. K1W22B-7]|uniref:flagellar biosynthesis protein FlhB n=1 Tax=Solimonas sp. K1W22B-7 TaxID=2303331 RepID=UPI000E3356B2|nr:flagellar biosynthesis protein FlhB [Solimonas sp. K1W22B-7]AXQ28201.1 flagellar biosynthesis protein FlhB [Solimonas sp. K1W22B-7]
MSESSGQEKTERATPKRQRDARKRGDIPRSRELATAAVLAVGVLSLWAFGGAIARRCAALMREGLSIDPAVLHTPQRLPTMFGEALVSSLWVLLPLMIALMGAVFAAPLLLGGFNFSVEALKPDFGRLNPVKGFGRIFSRNSLMEMLKAFLKFVLLGGLAGMFLWLSHGEFTGLSLEDPRAGIGHGLGLVLRCAIWLLGGLLVLAFIDAPYQWLAYQKKMRMTRQEVREEMKESEGRPEVKARIRQLQQQMASRRMMEQVPAADVIVTNPTHYAVALKYAAGEMRAPKVVAKGADEIARLIRELAAEHRIPVVSAPPLARALYRSTRLDQEIPAPLYEAVAQVLTYIYRLRQWRNGPAPSLPPIVDVPGGEPDPVPDSLQ